MKLKTIRLYGKLGAKFGRVHRLAVANAAEAVRALCVMLPGFESHMSNAPSGYAVFYGRENVGAEALGHPSGKDDIRIAPIPAGAKQGGIFQVVVGTVLIVAGFFTGGSTWGPAIDLWQALLRFLIAIPSWLCVGIGVLWMLKDKQGRTWSDIYSESQVVQLPKGAHRK